MNGKIGTLPLPPTVLEGSEPLGRGTATDEIGSPLLDSMPPPSPVLSRLMSLLMQDDVSIVDVGNLVRADLALSTQVLRVVNSPLFGLRREITGILEAISLIGLQRVKVMSFTLAMQNYLSAGLKKPVVRSAWRHGLATALVAEKLVADTALTRDHAYTAGLFHEIGLLMLIVAYPADVEKLLQRAGEEQGCILSLEREVFGLDHYELGQILVERWQLPAHLKDVMQDNSNSLNESKLRIPAVIAVACRIAARLGFSVVDSASTAGVDELLRLLPEYDRFGFKLDQEQLQSNIAAAINSIELSTAL